MKFENYIKFKVGDIVTQSESFYNWWKAPKFKRKIIKIDDDIIYLDKIVEMETLKNIKMKADTFHTDYLKIDNQQIRKEKLKKMNYNENEGIVH